jgi:hypothetical protein
LLMVLHASRAPRRRCRSQRLKQRPAVRSVNAPTPTAVISPCGPCLFEILHVECMESDLPGNRRRRNTSGKASDGTASINQCWASSGRRLEGRDGPHRDLEATGAGQDSSPSTECGRRWTRGSRRAWRRTPRGDGVSNGCLSLLGGPARPQRFFIRTVWRELYSRRLTR